jgi:hypothetical protein
MDSAAIVLLVSAALGGFGTAPPLAGSHLPNAGMCPHCLLQAAVIRVVTQMETVASAGVLQQGAAEIPAPDLGAGSEP